MKEKIETQQVVLPEGFTVRGADPNDIESALELFNTWSRSVVQQDEITDADAIRTEWGSPGFDPARDTRLVFSPEGELVGYIEVWTNAKPSVHPWIWGRVHPGFSGLGIGTWLLEWAESHACRVLEELPSDVRFAPAWVYTVPRWNPRNYSMTGAFARSAVLIRCGLIWKKRLPLRSCLMGSPSAPPTPRTTFELSMKPPKNRSAIILGISLNRLKKGLPASSISSREQVLTRPYGFSP